MLVVAVIVYLPFIRMRVFNCIFLGIYEFCMKTPLCNFDVFKTHFYIVKLVFTGVHIIFLILLKTHRLLVLVRTASPMF